MHIELQFYGNVTLIHQRLTDADALRRHFPFTSIFRYRGAHVDIVRYRYSRTSLHIDRYQVEAVAPCPIRITADTDLYVLVVLERGGVRYSTSEEQSKEFALRAGECRILFAKRGVNQAVLQPGETRLHVVCLAPELLHLLDEDFAELRAFMSDAQSQQLLAMPAQRMDSTFIARFERLLYTPYPSHKEYIRHFLREIPALISAYKGLLKGRDKESVEKVVIDQIIRYITKKIRNREHVRVAEICTAFPVSRRKLERMFRTSMHCLPTAYIRRIKMEEVAKVLIATNAPLDHIAWDFGYSDRRSLSLAFKKVLGELPSVYRLKNQKKDIICANRQK